ncbi:hypothetical protein K8Q96_00500, partial [Candidatus Nomurabacteria bacterium]|nr:hypothetical protein [Candidatus Nomurabacteria bacterium]
DSGMYDNGIVYYGFSAQNVQASLPQAVSTSSNNKLQISQLTLLASSINAIKELDIKVQDILSNQGSTTNFGEYASLFFTDTLQKVENSMAYIKGIVVETLKVGSPTKRTGITLYDEITGEPYCLSVANGTTKTTAGECVIIEPAPVVDNPIVAESCSDGIQNQDESDIDTGGICLPIPTPTCADGIMNQDETGIDEGGVCTPAPEPTPEPTPTP